jgi:protein-S-isoprenylcysteine O-methyltransferase Ste14
MNPIGRRIFQLLFLIVLQALILFVTAGSISWIEGWIYICLYFVLLSIAALIMIPKRKEVIAERSKGSTGGKPWDILLTRVMAIPSLGMLVVAGFQERLGWLPDLAVMWQVVGSFLFVLGYAIVIWAMYVNPFFSSVVRIQLERGHAAVNVGPYRYIRHPGYLGMITSAFGTVLMLDASWALIPCCLYSVFVFLRAYKEDNTLTMELPGYKEYRTATRYRLMPFVW